MATFVDTHELLQFARTFLGDRTSSLQHDVLVCTANDAAFPAILYCFSTIDLLGALMAGEATSSKGLTQRSKAYARRFMHYSDDQCSMLWGVFRHKIVHLAQPNPVKKINKNTTWAYWHDDISHHLKLVPIVPPVRMNMTSGISVEAEQQFQFSIRHLVADIVDSVHTPAGYLHSLVSDPDLQRSFKDAMTQIYEP